VALLSQKLKISSTAKFDILFTYKTMNPKPTVCIRNPYQKPRRTN